MVKTFVDHTNGRQDDHNKFYGEKVRAEYRYGLEK